MNSIPPSLPAPSPPPESSSINAGNGDTAATSAPSRGFAAAMYDASSRPAKKNVSTKSSDESAGGSPLPAAGNQAPPAPTALPPASPPSATPGNAAPGTTSVAGTTALAGIAPTAVAAAATPGTVTGPGPLVPPAFPAEAAGNSAQTSPSRDGQDYASSDAASSTDVSASAPAATDTPTLVPAAPDFANLALEKPGTAVKASGSPGMNVSSAAGAEVAHVTTTDAGLTAGANSKLADPTAAAGQAVAAYAASDSSNGVTAGAGSVLAAAPVIAGQDSSHVKTQANFAGESPATAVLAGNGTVPEQGPDAATVTGAAATTAAAAVASDAKAISELASTSSLEKHTRGTADSPLQVTSSIGDAGAGAAQSAAGTTSSGSDVGAPTFKVSASVDSGEFGQGVANQVATMVGRNIDSAKINVNPPALGPIEVRIAVQGDHAQVWMVSHSAVTRDALQANMPKLREMLGSQGFGQVSVDISQRSFQERSPTPQSYQWAGGDENDFAGAASVAGTVRAASGGLDAYA